MLLKNVSVFWLLLGLGATRGAAFVGELARRNSTGLTSVVEWDSKSLFIQGQRVFILSAEFHPWRLPGDPALWADVFQKIKANGFNTVSFYVNWALHFPTPDTSNGQGDFETGTYRDIELFIQEAQKAGLWLIARPGPYINGETTGGGFPGWVGNIAGSLRTNNANYTQAWTPYLTTMSKMIAKYQITNGGPIILVQAENEFSQGTTQSPYMQAIIDTYRANGIVIREGCPAFSRRLPTLVSNNPQRSTCRPGRFGGGFLLQWGATPFGGTGYEKYTVSPGLTNADFENVFYKENYAQTATILNIYMLFGGTNWGGTAAPVSYTSYDYGGGINENRIANAKMNEMRLQGLFLRVSRDLLGATLLANGTNYTTTPLMHTAELINLETGAGFYVLRHNDSTSTALTTTQVTVQTSLGSLVIPRTGVLTFNGRESKIIVTNYVFGQSQSTILYSTAEIDGIDYVILYAPTGQSGETAFRLPSAPTVIPSIPAAGIASSFVNGTLTLNYVLNGSSFVSITEGQTKIVAIILDKASANRWHAPIIATPGAFGNYFSIGTNETVLVSGPYVLRTAEIAGNTLSMTGDVNGTTSLEIVAPGTISTVVWNGLPTVTTQTSWGTLKSQLDGAPAITLPVLTNWKVAGSLPEIDPDFDDSSFTAAHLTTTNYTNLPPLAGNVVLYSQQYGFYGNHLIFRGRFTATGKETGVNLTVQYGFAGGYSVWLNGVFLGSAQGSQTVSVSTSTWAFPAGALRVNATNVLVVFQDHTGIVETNSNGGKEPRGIRGYALLGATTPFTSWTVQGNLGGAGHAPDTYRGYLNEGALYAERIGAHLPGFPDDGWASATPLSGVSRAGINFYRTTFDFPVPDGIDAPIRLSITRNSTAASPNFRLQIYLNGWQVGKYANSIGPQTIFVLPAGILRRRSPNTLGLMVWAMDATGAVIQNIELVSDGFYTTSLQFTDYVTPDYAEQKALRPEPGFYNPM
ncbi:Beta-galactosidase [Mycena indigotica]|uniref:Beta-galactosidase n=1 Tax=Mycena indigotica TaxID=2126181 RepID=A0A8H6SHY4_9AGAR|nr:Beta-galactosidase [Mycena indigotica]KAF7299197.1 Beta-galactosidase [Mycena indigotica]